MKKLIFCIMALLAVVACSDSGTEPGGNGGGGQTPPKQPQITLNASAVDFPTEGGSREVAFNSSEAWTAQVVNNRADDWCFIEPASGAAGNASIVITTTENDTPDDRTASVIIKAGTASKTVKVSQKQKDALTVTSSKFEVAADGGEVVVEVKANIDFDVEIDDDGDDWITHRSTRALKTSQLVFEISKNDDTENRKANIIIRSGNLRETITVYQEGNEPTIILSDTEFAVSSSKETIAIDVKSNVDVSIEIPQDANWIKENATRGVSTNTYYFDISENENYDSRIAEIKFTNKENNIFEIVKVTQSQKDAIVIANDIYTIDGDGGTIEIEVGHNVDFDVEIADDWITLQTTRAYETETLVFAIAENSGDESREGTITFVSADGSLKQVVKVVQNISVAEIIVTLTSPTYYNDLIAQVGKTFGNSVYTVTQASDYTTYSIILKEGYSEIPYSAFWNEDDEDGINWLKSITIGNGITSIGDYAFAQCYTIESVTIGNSVVSIGEGAFYGCEALQNVTIPDSVNSIGVGSFAGCYTLTSIAIGNGVTSIGAWAFDSCEALVSVVIPESVVSIGERAFYYCEALRSITIPSGVTSIGEAPFVGCYALSAFYGEYASIDNRCLIKDGVLLASAQAGLISYTIPDNVSSIGNYAFSDCRTLQSITIPDSISSIGDLAFYECYALNNVTIGNGVTLIGNRAFDECSSLARVYCKPVVPPSLGENVFDAPTIYVPNEGLASYQSNAAWNVYAIEGYDF